MAIISNDLIKAKSNQLNAVDLLGMSPVVTVERVLVNNTDQPVSIFYKGCNNRPYKPSKGMLRVIMFAWGNDTDKWIDRSMQLFCDPKVKWGGVEVGGIRIAGFSHIEKDLTCPVTLNRSVRIAVSFKKLNITPVDMSEQDFNQIKSNVIDSVNAKKITLEQALARVISKYGNPTPKQLEELKSNIKIEKE